MLQTRDIIWGLLFIGCAAAIQVEITPTQGVISIGDSKFFLCEVVGDVKDIDWYDPRGEKINPNRQDILVTRTELTSVLTIYHASLDSAGFYKCVAKNGDEEAEATVLVEIFQKITFQDVPSPQEFNEGDDAEIICNVVSSPQPIVYWQYKGSMINYKKDVRLRLLSNNHLQIRSIKKTDEGMYNCEARVMTRGELDFRAIKVVVNVLPTIRARQSEVNATGDVGTPTLLACDADGFPEPAVTWTYNNAVLETGDKYSLNEDGSELVIKDVVKVDEGDYTCVAKNKAGEKADEVSLNVFVQAKVTYLNNQSATEFDDEVTMTCEASGDPTPTISWSFENREFTDGEQNHDRNILVRSHARVSSLVLKNVQFTYAGRYLCTASNSIGQDSKSMFLEVRYAPKILGEVTVYTWEGNAANISCEVEAYPGAAIVWFSDGVQLPNSNSSNIKIYNTLHASFLEVTPDSQNDFGSYNCTATNMMGSESKEFLLIPADVPSAPEIQQVEPFSSTAAVVFMEPESFGGVPILKYRVEWRLPGRDWVSRQHKAEDYMTRIVISGLKPETTYEVRMSAINGKGEGENSPPSTFKTEPVQGEPAAPKLEIKNEKGNSLKVSWIKQDDGGSPIMHYLIRYKAKLASEWKPEVRVPNSSDYAVLNGLDWDTEYEVTVVAENQQGKSKPGVVSFRTSTEPTAVPGGSGMNTGAIVGILIVVFFMLLVGIDVTCYFLNKCGLLMCIAVNFCGKAGPGAKNKDVEEGKAAFSKDESKEPIVEVKADEAQTPNQGVAPTEPNETTPLTDPEPAVADPPSAVVNTLPETNSIAPSESNPKTTSSSTKATPGKSSPKNSPKANPPPDVGNLVDLSDAPGVAPSTGKPSNPSVPAESQSDSTKAPNTPRVQESQVEGAKGGAPQAPSTETTTPAPTDGKPVKDDITKGESDVKKETAEVKTVPNEAPQANGNESKA